MHTKTILIEMLLAGFFAIACLRAHEPATSTSRKYFADVFRLSGRLERLRRSRWQWFSLVALMLVLRLQGQLPLVLELMVTIEFAIFMALPKDSGALARAR
ncbi:MAG TPA: hypothetical protein VMM16_14720 [Verrucomicrobiae bacterium]|nr:hypothetical protein [Verrucomicrobiae bacterium]